VSLRSRADLSKSGSFEPLSEKKKGKEKDRFSTGTRRGKPQNKSGPRSHSRRFSRQKKEGGTERGAPNSRTIRKTGPHLGKKKSAFRPSEPRASAERSIGP